MVIAVADAIDGLKLYLKYIEKVSSNQFKSFSQAANCQV